MGDTSSYLSWRRYLKISHAITFAPMSCSTGRLLITYVCTTSLQHSSHQCGWQKDHTRVWQCFTLLCQLRWAGTRLPRISFTECFQEKLDQKRNLHGMRKTKVKQQLSLPEVSHDKVWWLTDRQTQRCPMGLHIHLFPFMLCHQDHRRGGGCPEVMATSPTPHPQHVEDSGSWPDTWML